MYPALRGLLQCTPLELWTQVWGSVSWGIIRQEKAEVTGSTPNVTGRGTSPSQAAVRGTERINGKSPSLLTTAFTSPIAGSQATI